MDYHNIRGITPTVCYDDGKMSYKNLVNSLVNSQERNMLIGATIGRSYTRRFIVLTNSHNHLNLIEKSIHGEDMFKIYMNTIHKLISNDSIEIPRVTGMSFEVFDNIINNQNICDNIKSNLFSQCTFLIAIPKKSIEDIINFIHNNKMKSSIFYIDDFYELFSIWTKFHEDKIKIFNMKHKRGITHS